MNNEVVKRRFMVNATRKHKEKVVPIIYLDDDDDLMPDYNYKLFLDQLTDDGPSVNYLDRPLKYEDDIDGTGSVTSKVGNVVIIRETEQKNRVSKQRERSNAELKAQIERDNRVAARRKRKVAELEECASASRGNRVSRRKISEVKAENLSDVRLVSDQDYMQEDNNVGNFLEVEVEVGTISVQEDIQRDSKIAEAEEVSVEALRNVPVSQRNEGASVERRKKHVGIFDEDYMSYLTWLVDSLKDSNTTKHMENLQNDQSHSDPPVSDALKESTTVPEKELLVKVKEELIDLEPWYEDSDIIAVSNFPFLDGDGTPFVVSKSAINLDEGSKRDESSSCWFKKELIDVLKKPYDERELRRLSKEVSLKRPITRYREFRKGREKSCKTNELGQSYLERYSDFDEEYKLVHRVDKAKALKLLRGFFFYLENVSHDGAFKPWEKSKQCLM